MQFVWWLIDLDLGCIKYNKLIIIIRRQSMRVTDDKNLVLSTADDVQVIRWPWTIMSRCGVAGHHGNR